MAIKNIYSFIEPNTNSAMELPGAVYRVETVLGNKYSVSANVSIYRDESLEGGAIDRRSYSFTPSMEGGNFIQQAYEHLKTLPEFAGAEDV